MTRGRHRQHLPVRTVLLPAAFGSLATAGVVLAVVQGDLQVLRLAVVASWLVALGLVTFSWRRGRSHARTLALQDSTRRVEEAVFSEQLEALRTGMGALQTQLERLTTESAELHREVAALRVDKAEAEEMLRMARAERAREKAAQQEQVEQRMLTVAAFEAAATVLEALEATSSGDETDWVSSWVASLSDTGELDLTMHDDTIPLELGVGLPVANSA